MKRLLLLLWVVGVGLFAQIRVGDTFPDMTLPDQFGKKHPVSSEDRMVLIAFEKDLFLAMSQKFKHEKKGFLKKHAIKVIADISGIPVFIARMFAIPKMRTYPFSILLIRDDSGKRFERRKGKVTLYILQNKKVCDVRFVSPANLDTIITHDGQKNRAGI
ncbi:hypothetical protein [Hydrogenimonas urashimensis]|uniref:hypothetical protein n=1 Tax=Hydrogenimonas urashimensis TaxID=2740515 RepID=UPI001915B7D7|nr:hypothetical protein [Hydrogenimonas urashimensis]